MLETDGGYVHSEGDTDWWIPSERVFYSARRSTLPRQSGVRPTALLSTAALGRPVRGATTLTVRPVRPAAAADGRRRSTTSTAGHDYRVLQPAKTTDANGNRSEAAFDTLGLVVGTAVRGKATEGLGDSLSQFSADLTAGPGRRLPRRSRRVRPRPSSPRRRRGSSTTWTASAATRQPIVAAAISRATHAGDPCPARRCRLDLSCATPTASAARCSARCWSSRARSPTAARGRPRWLGTGGRSSTTRASRCASTSRSSTRAPTVSSSPHGGVSRSCSTTRSERVVRDAACRTTPGRRSSSARGAKQSWDVNDTVLVADPRSDPDVGGLVRAAARRPSTCHVARAASRRRARARGASRGGEDGGARRHPRVDATRTRWGGRS